MKLLLTSLARLLDGPAPRLLPFLAIALLLRLPAVLWARGYEFLDHQFQYVDPAYHLAFDATWWRPWEYERGLRSWAYPGLLAGALRAAHTLGVTDPSLRMVVMRGMHAIVSLLPLLGLWHLLVRWRPLPQARPVLALAAVSGLFVYSGVQPNGPMWAAQFAVSGVLCACGPRNLHAWLAGLLLGIAFTGRFQDALFAPLLFAYFALQRRPAAALGFGAAFGLVVLAQGLLDLWTWGSFLHSPIEYVRANVFEGVANTFAKDSAWLYVPAVAVVTAFLPFVRSAWASVCEGARRYPMLTAAAVLYVIAHGMLERRAVRFVLPGLMLFTIIAAVGVFRAQPQRRFDRAHRWWFVALHVASALVLSLHYFHRGAIEAASALAARPDFKDRLLFVSSHANQSGIGGYYYFDRRNLTVDVVTRDQLATSLSAYPIAEVYAVVEREALAPASLPSNWRCETVGKFTDWPDLKARNHHYVYRFERRP